MSDYHKGIPGVRDLTKWFLRFGVLCSDMVAVSLSYWLAYWIRFSFPLVLDLFPVTKGYPPFSWYFSAAPVVLFMWFIAMSWAGTYARIQYPAIDEAIRIMRASFLGTILAMSAMFLYRESSLSRLVFLFGGAFSFVLIYLTRELGKILYVFWVRRNRRPHRVLVIGNGYLSVSLQKILERQGDRAILKKSTTDREEIQKSIVRSRIGEVLIAKPDFGHKQAIALANFCEQRGVAFRLLPDILEIRMGEVIIDESLGVPTFQLKPVSLHGTSFFMKRIIDLSLSLLFIFIFFIPLAAIAILIKLTSKGPIFYKQKRVGYRGKNFDFLKFRTMVQDADSQLEKLKSKSDRGGPVFKMKNDPRVTSIGKFLRRYSVDELPQLINVIRGEMSLVGPRPQVIWETTGYDEWAKKRLNVLPGITGLWQVSGRAELTFEEMIELDIYYIEHWSPGLDFKIIMKTIPAVLWGKGAY